MLLLHTTARATVDVELDHHCPHCGTVSPANVRGEAMASDRRTIVDLGGRSDAKFLAETEAQRNAALLIQLARCPACGKRDPAGLRRLWMRGVWAFALVAGGFGFAALSRGGEVPLTHGMGLMAGLLLAIWFCLALIARRELRASGERVKFIAPVASHGPYRS